MTLCQCALHFRQMLFQITPLKLLSIRILSTILWPSFYGNSFQSRHLDAAPCDSIQRFCAVHFMQMLFQIAPLKLPSSEFKLCECSRRKQLIVWPLSFVRVSRRSRACKRRSIPDPVVTSSPRKKAMPSAAIHPIALHSYHTPSSIVSSHYTVNTICISIHLLISVSI